MDAKVALVVTSIAAPNAVLKQLASGSQDNGWHFIVIGDEKSPSDFQLDGCDFYSLQRQAELDFKFARSCPKRHYARKNIGYLLAWQAGRDLIVETDDDNIPRADFWGDRDRMQTVPVVSGAGWVNAYRYFSEANIWPRGLPLDEVRSPLPQAWEDLETADIDCPIQQGLADENPDVDAIYRLVLPLPQRFRCDRRVALTEGSWCPFNSQNTTWWSDAFPLLYLPAYCSFRMTDIWRSFVAQRIATANNWGILFHEPTVWQDRNEHDLMRDFEGEIPGYRHNRTIGKALGELTLEPGTDKLGENLQICYDKLVSLSVIEPQELDLLAAWLDDIAALSRPRNARFGC